MEVFMLFGKSERKKSSACMLVVIGALAVVGAASITNKGKKIVNCVSTKIKGLVKGDEEM